MPGRAFRKPIVAKPTVYNGVRYDSMAEANRAAELDILLRAGRVAWWLRQVPILVGEPGVDKPWRLDFLVAEPVRGVVIVKVHVEDVKGFDTPEFRRHVRQWRIRGPFPLHVLRKGKVEIIEGGASRA